MSYLYRALLLFCLPLNFLTFSEELEEDKNDSSKNDIDKEVLLCRKCGADIADSNYIFTKTSPGASKVEKQMLFGQQNVTVQTLVNPFGFKFDVVTAEKARCENTGSPQGGDSWFPGYTWRICLCPFCGNHLGWTFENTAAEDKNQQPKTFYALVLSNILGENFTDSLIMMPKMYQM